MEGSRILKDFLYGELASSSRLTGRFKDVCEKDLKTCGIQPAELEIEVSKRTAWRAKIKEGIKSAEENRELKKEQKRTSRHQRTQPVPTSHTTPAADYTLQQVPALLQVQNRIVQPHQSP
ncbi:hypothetical protein ElyMa_003013300 [Elysia marginata]|uniref:Uncharacterized protein n=1 Tax=Elysia marginata TaxID=1093978 RepID=A0AAV4ID10_9GAST|nr:hypothetical protein ElyMa_003013300 [Elysia marginata]